MAIANKKMLWNKLGLVKSFVGEFPWSKTHATIPTPYLVNADVIRVFTSSMDGQGRCRPSYVDVSSSNPLEIVSYSREPIMDLGAPGDFDDNGVVCLSIISPEHGKLWMYYAGFEICQNIRYRIFTGLAISEDNGVSFKRLSRVPVLDRSDSESFFRCGSFVMFDKGKYRLWYVAGNSWTEINGKSMPVYDLRYQESNNGIDWDPLGTISLPITNKDEHGFGRPWIVKESENSYKLFYSIRSRSLSSYKLGYAESNNGINWERKDELMGLGLSSEGFDSKGIMYSSIININERMYCFYNGNNFGEDGFGIAELIK